MRDKWYRTPKLIRQAIGYSILWILVIASLTLSISLSIKIADLTTAGMVEQVEMESNWANKNNPHKAATK